MLKKLIICSLVAVGACGVPLGAAQTADEVERELRFASGLVELGLPAWADKVVQQLLIKHPAAKDRTAVINVQIMIANGRLPAAEEALNSLPASDPNVGPTRLMLGNAYYFRNDMPRARAMYDSFFKMAGATPAAGSEQKSNVVNAAFNYGQMLESVNDLLGAAQAFERALPLVEDRDVRRGLQLRAANLYVRLAAQTVALNMRGLYTTNAIRLIDKIQDGSLDVPQGRSIISLANINYLVKKNRAAAIEILKDNMDIFQQIDDALKEESIKQNDPTYLKESPMAGARTLLGQIYEDEGDAALTAGQKASARTNFVAAIKEYANVYYKYGENEWVAVADKRMRTLNEKMARNGWRVTIGSSGKAPPVAMQFKNADDYFRAGDFTNAVAEYIYVLNRNPDADLAPAALKNLAIGYAQFNDEIYPRMLAGYIGERFPRNGQAPGALLDLAGWYGERNNTNMVLYVYDQYLRGFPDDDYVPRTLFSKAVLLQKQGASARAEEAYQSIVRHYTNDQYYVQALRVLSWNYSGVSNWPPAASNFVLYVAALQPGSEQAEAQFGLANSLRQMEEYPRAVAEFAKLVGWLSKANSAYNDSTNAVVKNRDRYEKAFYFMGSCSARAKGEKAVTDNYKKQAVKVLDQFLQLFPASELAPNALNEKGLAALELGDYPGAIAALSELSIQYPQSEEGQNAQYALIRAAMATQRLDVARAALSNMLSKADSHKPAQFARVGQLMMEAAQYPEAAAAFAVVCRVATTNTLLQPAFYGSGKSLYEARRFKEAVAPLAEYVKRYPRSRDTVDVRFMLGDAYRALNQPDKAAEQLSTVFRAATNAVLANRANETLGQVQIQKGDLGGALASFLRVGELANPKDPAVSPIIERCLVQAVQTALTLKKYTLAQEASVRYEKLFPAGPRLAEVHTLRNQAREAAVLAPSAPPASKPGGSS